MPEMLRTALFLSSAEANPISAVPTPSPMQAGRPGPSPSHLRTNLEVNLLKMLPEAPRRPWLWPEGEAGVTP